MQSLHITNETARLRSVLLHRPGPEIERMIPEHRDALLFDELLWLPGARAEHAALAAILELATGPGGVVYIEDLLEDLLCDEKIRADLVGDVVALESGDANERETLVRQLLALSPPALATALIAGRPGDAPDSLSAFLEARAPDRPQPIPNLLFMRDVGAVVGKRAVVGAMTMPARRREPLLLRYALRFHPRFGGDREPLWWDPYAGHPHAYPHAHIEGGDVLVLSERALLVGGSERTDARGIDALARWLLRAGSPIQRIYVVLLPSRRNWMHLDTAFTLISPEECVLYPALFRGYGREGVRIVELELGPGGVRVREHTEYLPELLWRREGLCREAYEVGGADRLQQDREQWTDGANFVALAPGVVVGYERNERTFEELRVRGGYDVVSVEPAPADADGAPRVLLDGAIATLDELARRVAVGSGTHVAIKVSGRELSRARGGARCMTMPLVRDDA